VPKRCSKRRSDLRVASLVLRIPMNDQQQKAQISVPLNDVTGNHGFLETTLPNAPPHAGTTSDMIFAALRSRT